MGATRHFKKSIGSPPFDWSISKQTTTRPSAQTRPGGAQYLGLLWVRSIPAHCRGWLCGPLISAFPPAVSRSRISRIISAYFLHRCQRRHPSHPSVRRPPGWTSFRHCATFFRPVSPSNSFLLGVGYRFGIYFPGSGYWLLFGPNKGTGSWWGGRGLIVWSGHSDLTPKDFAPHQTIISSNPHAPKCVLFLII